MQENQRSSTCFPQGDKLNSKHIAKKRDVQLDLIKITLNLLNSGKILCPWQKSLFDFQKLWQNEKFLYLSKL